MAEAGDSERDLGFGAVAARSDRRLLNRDGTFNVVREGLGWWRGRSLYHHLLTMSWPAFLALCSLAFVAVNALFAAAYLACAGPAGNNMPHSFGAAFFFSVHTFATIGYGNMAPEGLAANLLVTLESLVGLLGPAVACGFAFARISRPTAKILFSDRAVIAPYRGGRGLMIRLANGWANELSMVEARLLYTARQVEQGVVRRGYLGLPLERAQVHFLPGAWTLVHPIDEASPFATATPASLLAVEAEVLVLLTAHDETFAQSVNARCSYHAQEIEFGAKFADLYSRPAPDEPLRVDLSRLSATEPAP